MKRYYATGSDWKIEEHVAGDLVRLSDHIAEIERLRKLYDAAWAECESYRRDAYCLNDEGKAHDTARKENGNGNA
jgi:hypothetical protein